MSPDETLEHSDIPIKTSLNLKQHAKKIKELSLEAVRMRRKIVEMGYINHIRLHYGALMSMCEIITLLYLHWLKLDPKNPATPVIQAILFFM